MKVSAIHLPVDGEQAWTGMRRGGRKVSSFCGLGKRHTLAAMQRQELSAPVGEDAVFGTRGRGHTRGNPSASSTVSWCARKDVGSSCDSDADSH